MPNLVAYSSPKHAREENASLALPMLYRAKIRFLAAPITSALLSSCLHETGLFALVMAHGAVLSTQTLRIAAPLLDVPTYVCPLLRFAAMLV